MAGLEALVFGVLVFVLGTLVIANAWGVLDAKLAVSSAAVSAVRTFVQYPGGNPASASRAAAGQAIANSGRSVTRMDFTLSGTATRCGAVVATVRYPVPLVRIPLLGGFGHGFTVAASHTELVDPYRSGLPGEATCATVR